jgi:hypothetical protein
MRAAVNSKKAKQKVGEFKIWIGSGHVNAKCEECGVTPSLEYMGLDPIYPKFKLVCSDCGTYDVMKIYLSCTKLYPIPYRGRKRFASQYGGKLA